VKTPCHRLRSIHSVRTPFLVSAPPPAIMDSFFCWTATALAAYLVGCDLFENGTLTGNGTGVASQDPSARYHIPSIN